MPADRSEGRGRPARALALLTGLALAAAPSGARAFGPPAESEQPESEQPESEQPESEQPEDGEPSDAPAEGGEESEPIDVEVEEGEEPSSGGVMGVGVVDPNDPAAKRAQSDLEGESLDKTEGVPERLPKLQAAGWWLVFGGVSLAAAGGVLGGIAETREDEAERLAYGFSLETGTTTQFGPVADEWNQTLREGRAFQAAARGLIIGGAVVLLAGVGVFIADGVQRKRSRAERPRVRVQPSSSGVVLRF
ncbi:hypothetical protein ACNOYE_00300 [Nannocystaceae bacterium ST9]